jgi:hypothetical protein
VEGALLPLLILTRHYVFFKKWTQPGRKDQKNKKKTRILLGFSLVESSFFFMSLYLVIMSSIIFWEWLMEGERISCSKPNVGRSAIESSKEPNLTY